MFWAKDGSEKSRFTEVVNASKLQEKFVPHNKSVSLEEQKEVVKMLQEKFLSGMEDGARKDGLPKWDAAKNIAYVPASENEQQVMKDTIAMVSSSIVARDSVAGSEIRFKREVSKEEKILLRHFVASEIRTKLGLGPDERNGLSRESTTDKKNVVNAMKRNERLCGNVARRARGIVNKIGREFGLEVLNSQAVKRGKDTKEQSQEQSKSL